MKVKNGMQKMNIVFLSVIFLASCAHHAAVQAKNGLSQSSDIVFRVIACNGPMQDGVKVFLLNRDTSLVPKGQTINNGSRTLSKKQLQKALAVVFCKKGFHCCAKWTSEIDYANSDEGPIMIPEILNEDRISGESSNVISFNIKDCDKKYNADPQFDTVLLMKKDGTLAPLKSLIGQNQNDFKINKSELKDGKYLFFCSKLHNLNSCTMIFIDEPDFWKKNDRIISMSRFFVF